MSGNPGPRTEKRERIIGAAIEVFAEKGFHLARISDIADRAGVADGTIYPRIQSHHCIMASDGCREGRPLCEPQSISMTICSGRRRS